LLPLKGDSITMKKGIIAIVLTSLVMIALIVVLLVSIFMITPDITRVTAASDFPAGDIILDYRDDSSTPMENAEASVSLTTSASESLVLEEYTPLSEMPRTGDNGTLTGILLLLGISLAGVLTGLWHIWKGRKMHKESI